MSTDQASSKKGPLNLLWFLFLAFCGIGVFLYPDWWHEFIFERKILTGAAWTEGLTYLSINFGPLVVLIFLAILCGLALASQQSKDGFRHFAASVQTRIEAHSRVIEISLAALVIVGFATLPWRYDKTQELYGPELSKWVNVEVVQDAKKADEAPLANPTTFVFIDRTEVQRLYGQFEPELIPATVLREMQESSDVKVGLSVQEYLKTDVGKSQYSKKVEEFKSTAKSDERKLKELLQYLADKKVLQRYGDLSKGTPRAREIDDAVAVLANNDIQVDQKRLALTKEKLLAEQLDKLEADLRNLHGLVLVEGDWLISANADGASFKKPFVPNIRNPIVAEFEVKTSDLPEWIRIRIHDQSQPLRLSLVGSVIVGPTAKSLRVVFNPIAVYQ